MAVLKRKIHNLSDTVRFSSALISATACSFFFWECFAISHLVIAPGFYKAPIGGGDDYLDAGLHQPWQTKFRGKLSLSASKELVERAMRDNGIHTGHPRRDQVTTDSTLADQKPREPHPVATLSCPHARGVGGGGG